MEGIPSLKPASVKGMGSTLIGHFLCQTLEKSNSDAVSIEGSTDPYHIAYLTGVDPHKCQLLSLYHLDFSLMDTLLIKYCCRNA